MNGWAYPALDGDSYHIFEIFRILDNNKSKIFSISIFIELKRVSEREISSGICLKSINDFGMIEKEKKN